VRKDLGSHYTHPALVDFLLSVSLDCLIQERLTAAEQGVPALAGSAPEPPEGGTPNVAAIRAAKERSQLVHEGLLHPRIPQVFRSKKADPHSPPVRPYLHQSEASRIILDEKRNCAATMDRAGVVRATCPNARARRARRLDAAQFFRSADFGPPRA